MPNDLDNSISESLYEFRKKKGLSSTEVAKALGFASHKSIIDLEFGRKKITEEILTKLAALYDTTVDELKQNQDKELSVYFRSEEVLQNEKTKKEFKDLYTNVKLYFDLLEKTYPHSLTDKNYNFWTNPNYRAPLNKSDAVRQGELLAKSIRNNLGLGEYPLFNILRVCELLNVVTLFFDFKKEITTNISGIYFQYKKMPLILINASHKEARKRFSIAHELCHFLIDSAFMSQSPEQTEVFNPFEEKFNRNYREIRANAFAAALLMPEEGVKNFVRNSLDKNSKSITIHDIIHISHNYGVSFDATTYRLRNLELITENIYESMRTQTYDSIQAIKNKLYSNEDNLCDEDFTNKNFISRLRSISIEAFRNGYISVGKLCEIFEHPVVDQKQLLLELQLKAPKLPKMERSNPLL